jgi:hypothetical protein
MGTFNEDPLRIALDLTGAEEALLAAAETGNTSQINKTRVYSAIYSVKHMEGAVSRLIASNEGLSLSNDRYARAMNVLTAGLLIVAVIQVVVYFVPWQTYLLAP